MKKMLVLLTSFVLTVGAASAQTTAAPTAGPQNLAYQQGQALTPEQHADRQAARLTKQLGLSAEQTAKVRAAALTHAQQLRAQTAATPGSGARGPEMKALKESYNAQLKSILTPDQLAQYDQLRTNKMNQHRQVKAGKIKVKG